LLYLQRRYTEANEAMKYLGGGEVPEDMRRMVEESQWREGKTGKALEMAKHDIEKNPDDPSGCLWYGLLLHAMAQPAQTENAFAEATKKAPTLPRAWEALVMRLIKSKKKNEAVEAVREASRNLSKDSLAMARLYQMAGDLVQAEEYYKAAVAETPDNPAVFQRAVEFYLATNQPGKAVGHLDQIIRLGLKSPSKEAAGMLTW